MRACAKSLTGVYANVVLRLGDIVMRCIVNDNDRLCIVLIGNHYRYEAVLLPLAVPVLVGSLGHFVCDVGIGQGKLSYGTFHTILGIHGLLHPCREAFIGRLECLKTFIRKQCTKDVRCYLGIRRYAKTDFVILHSYLYIPYYL